MADEIGELSGGRGYLMTLCTMKNKQCDYMSLYAVFAKKIILTIFSISSNCIWCSFSEVPIKPRYDSNH